MASHNEPPLHMQGKRTVLVDDVDNLQLIGDLI